MEIKQSKWLLVYTKAREEERAKKNLEQQGFETFLPMISYQGREKKINSMITMFPRYLFVKFNIENASWNRIKSTRGVSHIITFGDKPSIVPFEIIKYLRKKVDENNAAIVELTESDFVKDEKLLIKNGIFKGTEASYIESLAKDRVMVLLNFINRLPIKANIPLTDVEKKEVYKRFAL